MTEPTTTNAADNTATAHPSRDALAVADLTLRRGQLRLGPLSFLLQRGEKVALLGPNGGGKTSLLLTLAGLLPASSGWVARPARLALAGDGLEQLTELTVQESLADAAALHGLAVGAVKQALDTWQLAGVSQRPVASLSLGFRQRLGLALATLAKPDVLLLDEPGNGLDPEQQQLLNDWLNRDRDTTVLLVSHQIERLPTCIERALLLAALDIGSIGLRHDGPISALPSPWRRAG